jgi:hypothetical protein
MTGSPDFSTGETAGQPWLNPDEMTHPDARISAPDNTSEVQRLERALHALGAAMAGDTTVQEAHALRRAVIEATVALERQRPRR